MEKPPKEPSSPTSPFELPEERLATTGESGKRLYLYPAAVRGIFRTYRTAFYWVLILIFLILPWIQVGQSQAILLNIPNRQFAIFGLTFWAHEAPIFVLVLLSFMLIMGIVTSLFGRIWCGWACPQTVFIDRIYRKIEELIEGVGQTRRREDQKKLTGVRLIKKIFKWLCFLAASLVITHSFLAYFVGSQNLLHMISRSPAENLTPFLIILFTTGVILFDFGWFREQFCVIACPYGRIQSVFMDSDSLVVAYDYNRGEPRKKDRKDTTATGDCINCYRCVQVCPTGIDIRRGVQMECVMCTACIDACDEVMEKINRPKGLIRYDTENRLSGKPSGWIRPRTGVYMTLLIGALFALIYLVTHRNMTPVHFLRDAHPPYKVVGTTVVNHFQFSLRNQYFVPIGVSFSLPPDLIQKGYQLIQPVDSYPADPGKKIEGDIFIQLPQTELLQGRLNIMLTMHLDGDIDSTNKTEGVTLIGPLN